MLRRTVALVAAPVLALTLTGVVAVGAGLTPASAQSAEVAAVVAAEAEVGALRADVERATADLVAGTTALEQGQARLAQVSADAQARRGEADEALLASGVARDRLGLVVRAGYSSPPPSALSVALSAPVGELNEAMLAQAGLDRVRGSQEDLIRQATDARVRADSLVREADQLEAEAAEQESALEVQVDGLSAQAEQINARLQQAAARLAAAEQARRVAEEKAARERAEAAARAERERLAAEARASRERAAAAAAATAARQPRPAPARAQAQAPAPRVSVPSGGGGGSCSGSAGSYPNGFIPASALCPISGGGLLRADAAAAFNALAAERGGLCVTDTYRDYASQVSVYARKPGLAAVPGTSNHGFGIAVDLCGGVERFGSEAYEWMKANAPRFGWEHPSWAEPGGARPEPWHWEYVG